MANLVTDFGEEFTQDLVVNSGETIDYGLYLDTDGPGTPTAGDDVVDGSDLGTITTEPSGSNFSRQSVSASNLSASLDGSNNVVLSTPTLTFDVSDSTQNVNAVFAVVNYQSDLVASDGSQTDRCY